MQNSFANSSLTQNIQNTYKQLNAFQADFTQELFHRESQHTQKKSGVFSFKKDQFIRFETKEPNSELLIVNPEEIWNFIPDEEIAYKYNSSLLANSNNILSVLTGKTSLNTDFEIEVQSKIQDTNLHKKDLHFLKIYPLEPTVELTEADIYIDPDTFFIVYAKVYDFYGNTNSVSFNNIIKNPTFDDAFFSFTPPKGIDVEDHSATDSSAMLGISQ